MRVSQRRLQNHDEAKNIYVFFPRTFMKKLHSYKAEKTFLEYNRLKYSLRPVKNNR